MTSNGPQEKLDLESVVLPDGWAATLIGDLFTINYGKALKAEDRKGGAVPVYGSNGKVGTHSVPVSPGPTLILGRKGSVGEVHICDVPCWPIDTTFFLDEMKGLDPRFLFFTFQSLDLSQNESSTAIPGLSRDDIYARLLALAPLAEQKRIAAKVGAVLAKVDAVRRRLAKVPAILKRFRQSVLAAACSGRLTEGWRETVGDHGDAAQLLAQITLLRQKRGGKDVKPVSQLSACDSSELPEIPAAWLWARFGDVIGELRNGIGTRPNMSPPGCAILRINAARPGRVLLETERYLPASSDLIEQYCLADGDLLFTRYNGSLDLLGVCGMVRQLAGRLMLYPDKLMRVRFDHDQVLPEYVEAFFQTPGARERMTDKAKSSAGQQGISGSDVKGQPISLPPLPEQHEIVRRVSELFALADKVEARLAAATATVKRVTRAVLAKAFRGELVETEASLARREGRDYESAAQLLERLRAEKPTAPSKAAAKPARVKKKVKASKPKIIVPKLSRGAYFKRGAIAAYAVQRLHNSPYFGQIQLEKVLYLAETHIGLELEGRPTRKEFGPLDPYIYKLESLAGKLGWFIRRARSGGGSFYVPGGKIAERLEWADRMLGDRRAEMDRLLEFFAKADTERAEILATVFAAWNDFLIAGVTPTDQQIITEVRENWHEAKQRFTVERLQKCIDYMRTCQIIPRGRGPSTVPQTGISPAP